jgi:hypothetical protein
MPNVLVLLECQHSVLFKDLPQGPVPDAIPCFECRKPREDVEFKPVIDHVWSGPQYCPHGRT